MCDDMKMMSAISLLILALTTALASPAYYKDYNEEVVPQKRAALVLDRLLVALQKALHEDATPQEYEKQDRDGPYTAPLRISEEDINDVSSLERRGQSNGGRGRVLRCYFNAVTCF